VLHAAGNEVRSGKSAAGFAYVHGPKAPRPIIYVLKQMIVQFAILARVRRRRGALHDQLAMSDNREESFSLLEDIIVADSQLVPKNVAVTPGVRVAHLSCSEFLAGQNITVVVLRQTNRHIDGIWVSTNSKQKEWSSKPIQVLQSCNLRLLRNKLPSRQNLFLPTRLIPHRLDAIPVGVDDIFHFAPKNDLLPPIVNMSGFVYKPH
jgi:hypothetical protein